MKRNKKTVLLIAAGLLVLGTCLATAAVAIGGVEVLQKGVTIDFGRSGLHVLSFGDGHLGLFQSERPDSQQPSKDGKYDSAEGAYDRIEVQTIARDIEVTRSEDEAVHVTYPESSEARYEITDRDGTFKVAPVPSVRDESSGTLRIAVPRAFAGELDLSSVSGSVSVCAFDTLDELSCETVSGTITLEALTAEEVDCETVSGKVQFESLAASEVSFSAVSGDITGTLRGAAESWSIQTSTVSGNLPQARTGGTHRLSLETISGDASLSFAD
ncbi:MAG: hypothetical protein EOM69_02640 [Clostridia bacterium]|nr:hypothetical protein [Clostridia bacterium]